MKMFTKLIGSVLMLLFISALGLGQSQQVVNSAVDGIDNPAGTSTKIVLVQQIDINKISNYGGPSDAIIFDNGPLITHPTGGFGGAPASALQSVTGPMLSNYGYGGQQASNNRLADDFSVPAGSTWTLSTIKFFSYQTGSTTTSTITGVFVQIWSGNPSSGGTLLWGDITTNRLSSTAFSGIYRSIESALTASNRPIMDVIADVSTCPVLTTGTYWVDVCFTGSLTSGPWLPPVTIWNTGITGDAIQHLGSSSTWAPIVSGTAPNTYAQGIPFVIDGTASVPICLDPSGQGVTNITLTSADLTWTSLSGLSDVEFGVAGFTPTGVPTDAGVTSPLSKSSLSAATSYSFYVRDDCGGGSYSSWIGPYTFSTFCGTCTGTPEGEPQLVNGSTLAGINGGCAYGDPLLTSPITLGDTYCGQSNSFINDLGGAARDNDYYYLDLNSPANIYWNINITLKGNGLYNVIFFDAGDMTCAIGAVAVVTTTSSCELATINVDVPSGNYYIVARVATATGNLWPAGSGPWTYVLTVNGTQLGAPNLNPDAPAEITQLVAPGGTASINLPIGNSGTYALDYSAVTSGTYSQTWEDQFDTYAAGVQLAVQNPTQWTTWSNAPGSAEDPFVSNEQAYTGANSVKIEGTNDAVHEFGNLTTGSYLVSHRMYVVAGYVGYFNTLLTFGAISEWGMQVAFETDGTATLDAGVFSAATFAYTPDTWMLNEVYVDLDNDYAEYWFNGAFVWSWQWSVGTGGYSTNQLAANNFFAYTGAGGTDTPRFWIDDYKLLTAGNDWLTLDGGLGASGTIAVGGGSININIGFDASTKPIGEYTKVINLVTNELGAKTSYAIPVTMRVGYSVSGNVYYGTGIPPNADRPMDANTTVTLSTTPTPTTVSTGTGGSYEIRPLANGTYELTGATTKPWGASGFAQNDILVLQRWLLNLVTLNNLQKRAADVSWNDDLTQADLLVMKRRNLNIITSWPAPNYVFDGPFNTPAPTGSGLSVTVSNANVIQLLRTLCSGDVNGSLNPVP